MCNKQWLPFFKNLHRAQVQKLKFLLQIRTKNKRVLLALKILIYDENQRFLLKQIDLSPLRLKIGLD